MMSRSFLFVFLFFEFSLCGMNVASQPSKRQQRREKQASRKQSVMSEQEVQEERRRRKVLKEKTMSWGNTIEKLCKEKEDLLKEELRNSTLNEKKRTSIEAKLRKTQEMREELKGSGLQAESITESQEASSASIKNFVDKYFGWMSCKSCRSVVDVESQ